MPLFADGQMGFATAPIDANPCIAEGGGGFARNVARSFSLWEIHLRRMTHV